MVKRRISSAAALLFGLCLVVSAQACASAPIQRDQQRLEVAKVTRDVVTATKTAHATGKLAEVPATVIMVAADRVLQAIAEDPKGYVAVSRAALKTARDALTAGDRVVAAAYLDKIDFILTEVTK